MKNDTKYLLQCLDFQSYLGVDLISSYDLNEVDIEIESIDMPTQKLLDGKSEQKENQKSLSVSEPKVEFYNDSKINMPQKDLSVDLLYKKTKDLIDSSDINTLEELKSFVLNFDYCDLKKTANNTVFGDGCPDSKIMIIGEAPGEEEDKRGIPFCGKSGKLLTSALSSIGLEREKNFYITNSVFWRPPGNRNPTGEERAICKPIIEKYISIIKPSILILCGSVAMESMLFKSPITKVAGQAFDYKNSYMSDQIVATPIAHPSYLLRNPYAKKDFWFCILRIKNLCSDKGIKI